MRKFFFAVATIIMLLPRAGAAQTVATVPTNAALKVASTTSSPVFRAGFNFAGDGGGATYNFFPTNCAIPDDGAEVQPTGVTGCWIADLMLVRPTPMIWGCNGTANTPPGHDDHDCLQAAINASSYSTLYNGPHVYCIKTAVAMNFPITYIGDGNYVNPISLPDLGHGIRQCAPNINLININGNSVAIKKLFLRASDTPGSNTGGTSITIAKSTNGVVIEDVTVQSPCIGIDLDGFNTNLNRIYAMETSGTGCYGVRVGHHGIAGQTQAPITTNSVMTGPDGGTPPSAGLFIENSGGLYMSNVGLVYTGTKICPGAGQQFAFSFVVNTEFGDTSPTLPLEINTCDSTATVLGNVFSSVWASSAKSTAGIAIANSGGGFLSGLHFSNLLAYNNFANGLLYSGVNVTDVTFDRSSFCGNGQSGALTPIIFVGFGQFTLQNSRVANVCDGLPPPSVTQIPLQIGNGSDNLLIVGNDFTGYYAGSPIVGLPSDSAVNVTVSKNLGVDGALPTIPSGATITLGYNPVYALSATTSIQTISGHPSNWTVTLIPRDGPINFVTGGNICRAITAGQFQRITMTWISGFGCWSN